MHVKLYCLRGEIGAGSRGGTKLLRRGLQSKMWSQLRSDHLGPKLGDGIAKKDPSRCVWNQRLVKLFGNGNVFTPSPC